MEHSRTKKFEICRNNQNLKQKPIFLNKNNSKIVIFSCNSLQAQNSTHFNKFRIISTQYIEVHISDTILTEQNHSKSAKMNYFKRAYFCLYHDSK